MQVIERINPRYIFFPHWSWIIPNSVLERWECVIFHLGDVPDGRGGSPLQNHIERKIYTTCVSALRATRGIDEGPVYCKKQFSLYGGAEEIFLRLSKIIFREIIPYILENNPKPQEQQGEGSYFPRREKDRSDFTKNAPTSLDDIFDLIRMLDAEGYPKAYLDYGPFRLAFGRAQRKYGKVIADVEITMQGGEME
ncbi:MAG: methionyl-tRNA formyltransferase [Synergistaceae bacterium]|nr:methionyl-tRNA formyltransferase [Synergistaceae bacterium]